MKALVLISGLAFVAFGGQALAAEAAWDPAPCPARLWPVCAASPCSKDNKNCSIVYSTVSQRTFANAQCAKAAGAQVLSRGACADDPLHAAPAGGWNCPSSFAPVWGSRAGHAKTYSNACEMASDGAAFMGLAGMRGKP